MSKSMSVYYVLLIIVLLQVNFNFALAYSPFLGHVKFVKDKPKLILISGSPGTGKSTFGMSVALDQGILKCISTDTVRAVMRSFVAKELSPALHRSSYSESFESDDPVRSWMETCNVLKASIDTLVDDAICRRVSLVVEGVHLVPSPDLIKKWEEHGGVAIGVLLQIQDSETHKKLLKRRGFATGNVDAENEKISSYERIRLIQDEMMKLASESNWLQIEQKTDPDPLDLIALKLDTDFPEDEEKLTNDSQDSDVMTSDVSGLCCDDGNSSPFS